MPLNMNTVGTGIGIGGNSGGESLYGTPEIKTIDNSKFFDISSAKIYKKISTLAGGRILSIGIDDSGNIYTYTPFSKAIYRKSMIVNTNNTMSSGLSSTAIISSSNYFSTAIKIDNYIYYAENDYSNCASPHAKLFRRDIKSGQTTQILPEFLTYYNNEPSSGTIIILSYSHTMIDNCAYILFMTASTSYATNSYKFTVVKDDLVKGALVIATSSTRTELTGVSSGFNGKYGTNGTGLERLYMRNSENLGISKVTIDSEYVSLYFSNLYMHNDSCSGTTTGSISSKSFDMVNDNWRLQIGISTNTAVLTLLASTTIDSGTIGNAIWQSPMSNGTAFLATTCNESEYGSYSGDFYYASYFKNIYIMHNKETIDITKVSNVDGEEMKSFYDKYDSSNITTELIYYPCKYRDVLLVTTNSETYPYPIDLTKTSTDTESIYTQVTWMFEAGDSIICDAGILSVSHADSTSPVNSASYQISSSGVYTFKLNTGSGGEQSSFIIKSKNGGIVCPGITFVDATHVSGYFIKGLKINGTKITTTGYQTVTGTFNGRVTISK